MFKSDTKILVSGCGITYTGQPGKTWAKILRLLGISVIDVSGPAVSNQWIINRAFLKLEQDPTIKKVIIQLTGIGKLDVEVDADRELALVKSDSLRNFTIDGIWPSSTSTEHPAKEMWKQYLSSPGLEQQDIYCKLKMLESYCNTNSIELVVIQGYNLYWSDEYRSKLTSIIHDIDNNIMDEYKKSKWWLESQHIDTPVLPYQFEIATKLIRLVLPEQEEKLNTIKDQFNKQS